MLRPNECSINVNSEVNFKKCEHGAIYILLIRFLEPYQLSATNAPTRSSTLSS
jgi:hypothetical protein